MYNLEFVKGADVVVSTVFFIGACLSIYLMQIRLKKCDEMMPGIMSSSWLLGLAIFSLAIASISNFLLVDIYSYSTFPSVADLFTIVGYIAFLVFLLRMLFPGEANMWLASVAGAAILSFQALLLQYIVMVKADVSMSVILQFMYILLGFTFTIVSLYLSHRYSKSAAGGLMLALGVFSISQLGGNWFYSASISAGGSALAQSSEIGAVLVRIAGALTLGMGAPLALCSLEGISLVIWKMISKRPFQLALAVMLLVAYLLLSSIYLLSINFQANVPQTPIAAAETETLLRDNMIAAQGAFQIYLIFAIVLGYSQTSLRRQEFEDRILQMNKELDRTVAQRTEELKKQLAVLEKFKRITIGRELQMIELKNSLRKLIDAQSRGRRGGRE